MEPIELVVQADDFGMCHAVNLGVASAVSDGIVTQVSTMPACPWFGEAATIAPSLGVPLGLHQTLTCEWDHLRWGPISGARSIAPGGTFCRTVASAAEIVGQDAAVEELLAQAARASEAGLSLSYTDVHMGMVAAGAYGEVGDALDLPFLYPGLPRSLEFASIAMLSTHRDKSAWLLRWIAELGPGRHLLVTHPGVDSAELASLNSVDSPSPWAREFRVSDLAVLVDPAVRHAVANRGIALVSV